MSEAIIGFAVGVWLCQQQSVLTDPLPYLMAALLMMCGVWGVVRRRSGLCRIGIVVSCLLIGFAYADWRASMRLAERLPHALEGENLLVKGRIEDIPRPSDHGVRFRLQVLEAPEGVPPLLQLAWYDASVRSGVPDRPAVHAGQIWQLLVRLHRVHGNVNPHGFDYEGWMFERGIGASGYVLPKGYALQAGSDASLNGRINRWREAIGTHFREALPDSPWCGTLVALVTGDQSGITTSQWTLLRQTGTVHLMSISGLHVTLIATLAGLLAGALWRRVPFLALRIPAQKTGILAGLLAACLYAVLAGFNVPAQRTLFMLGTAAAAIWSGRSAGVLRILVLALLAVLLLDPWAVLSAGFWLSFGAVGALLLAGRIDAGIVSGRIGSWLRAQWVIMLFTLPMLLALFQQFSVVSPFANVLAVPVISILVTPLVLLFGVLPISLLAHAADWIMRILMSYLQFCAGLPFAVWHQAAPPWWLSVLCCLAALWSFMPRGVPGRWTGLLLFLPLLAWMPPRPQSGDMQMTVLDVGQGLSVHVRTAAHDLLFDTGPRYSASTDAGERIVLPYLRAEGVEALDMLMVSHQDSDHSGGAASIMGGMPVRAYSGSLPAEGSLARLHPPRWMPCMTGQSWHWDGVSFELLNPPQEWIGIGNEGSCVLRIATAHAVVLLTGDIGQGAENAMLETGMEKLRSNIVVAPHHGSKTSSKQDFVDAVGASHAVFTSGYRNRYHHPAAQVVSRYVQAGAKTYRSDFDGAVSFGLDEHGISSVRSRQVQVRYWFDSVDDIQQ